MPIPTSKIIYDSNLMKVMSLFETLTKVQLKDCFTANGAIYFVVESENMGKAIGKSGANIRRMESLLKRRTRVIEYSPDLATFIKNLIYPLTAKQIDVDDGKVTITGPDTKTKAMLIGRNSSNLNHYKEIIRRYFEIREIRVI
ncbi:NusA-like transcription termination signal-binding factor [Candidatus Woesearchaeota archaeon]|nr:NusA-like transcription termination signal-binding factor [Candidatus Woesearchaeota archaeon]